jgi:hypothetical protein
MKNQATLYTPTAKEFAAALFFSSMNLMVINFKNDVRSFIRTLYIYKRARRILSGGVTPYVKHPHVSSKTVKTPGPGPELHFGSSTCYHYFFQNINPGL